MEGATKVYKLKHPVVLANTTIAELTFREARAKDFRELPADESRMTVGHFLNIAARLANQPVAVLDALNPEDFAAVAELISDFLRGGQPTGD